MTIGERIKERREELNISQSELATKLGYKSRSSINKIELGLQNLTQSKIRAIATALDTTPAFIMGWDNESDEWSQSFRKSLSSVLGTFDVADAEAVGLDLGKWQAIEESSQPISLADVCDFCDTTGLSLDEMLGRNKEQPIATEDNELLEIAKVFTSLNSDNRAKLLELSRLYLAAQRSEE